MPWNYPSLNIEPAKLEALTADSVAKGVKYKLGAKIDPKEFYKPGDKVDCSGHVRYLIFHATNATGKAIEIPDGSWNQEEWFKKKGYKPTGFDAALLVDDGIRIAFKQAGISGIRHVMLIANGMTHESRGGKGPDSVKWGSRRWHRDCTVYVLNPPPKMV